VIYSIRLEPHLSSERAALEETLMTALDALQRLPSGTTRRRINRQNILSLSIEKASQ
jgi:hypothetical protein